MIYMQTIRFFCSLTVGVRKGVKPFYMIQQKLSITLAVHHLQAQYSGPDSITDYGVDHFHSCDGILEGARGEREFASVHDPLDEGLVLAPETRLVFLIEIIQFQLLTATIPITYMGRLADIRHEGSPNGTYIDAVAAGCEPIHLNWNS